MANTRSQTKIKQVEIIENNIKNIDTDAPLSNAIIDLNPAHIITTNYDKFIENCKNEVI